MNQPLMNARARLRWWTQRAERYGTAPEASWTDLRVMELERREILPYIVDGDRVLDVGCGNGYTTLQIAREKRVRLHGVDAVPAMIKQARRAELAGGRRPGLRGEVSFAEGDITALGGRAGRFDKVIAIRVVINLGSWREQLAGLRECARVLKRGGLLLLSDATLQGWRNLNRLRTEWGLPEVPMPAFNLYLDEDQVASALPDRLALVRLVNFSSTYFVTTRVLKPLLIAATGAKLDAADPGLEWNRLCAQLPAWGDYGTQKLFVFRKR